MKSLQRRFERCAADHPSLGSFITLARAVRGQRFSKDRLQRNFNKLVDKADYEQKDKQALLEHLYRLTDSAEAYENRGKKSCRTGKSRPTSIPSHPASK